MNYLRKYRNRRIIRIELVSALDQGSFLISPPDGFTAQEIPVEYNGVYFTINSIELTQKPKTTNAGVIYTVELAFSFPNFEGSEDFQQRFIKLSEIKLSLNTKNIIRLNTNDVGLNKPISVEFSGNIKTLKFSASLQKIFPLKLGE